MPLAMFSYDTLVAMHNALNRGATAIAKDEMHTLFFIQDKGDLPAPKEMVNIYVSHEMRMMKELIYQELVRRNALLKEKFR